MSAEESTIIRLTTEYKFIETNPLKSGVGTEA